MNFGLGKPNFIDLEIPSTWKQQMNQNLETWKTNLETWKNATVFQVE